MHSLRARVREFTAICVLGPIARRQGNSTVTASPFAPATVPAYLALGRMAELCLHSANVGTSCRDPVRHVTYRFSPQEYASDIVPSLRKQACPCLPGHARDVRRQDQTLRGDGADGQNRIGAFGISRGGNSVMQLAGTVPEKVKAVAAIAGHPFGYKMSEEEMVAIAAARNHRSTHRFGPPDGPPSFPTWSVKKEREIFAGWSLSSLGLVERINMPVLMINDDNDHLAPIGNIHYMLESGPVGTRSAKIYKGSGHCAFEHQTEWGPATFRWLRSKPSAE